MLLSQQQSDFDQISLYRSISTKYREKNVADPFSEKHLETFWDFFCERGFAGALKPPPPKKQDFSPHF